MGGEDFGHFLRGVGLSADPGLKRGKDGDGEDHDSSGGDPLPVSADHVLVIPKMFDKSAGIDDIV